ncbi:hypothetical protein CHS0354_031697 [Potamilus streckersoni]|uniref:Cyclic nucleotide-binding domain-containing protein n=1 Tax=Potamilus streckersoni TaxID=2493646 RepID=A0AAE0SRZ2_9BIVA|nr:hypothetical protein CHS0354_031697 [Potamilus streckersoni]
MPSVYERVLSVIRKPPELRAEFECQELVSWFRNKSVLFRPLKTDIVADVIRHCAFERRNVDSVIIRQGETGDRLYIILKGSLSVYVQQDKENTHEILQQIERACAKDPLDRVMLGQKVWTGGEGHTVGEIALIKEECLRTASVVADTETDLVVIDRKLYNRSVQDVLEREYNLKVKFVEENPLFQNWPPKQKRQLIISLKFETLKYGVPLTRQGFPVNSLFFLLSGEMEITLDQNSHKTQYPSLWSEMENLLPDLLPKDYWLTRSPHETLRQRRQQHKPFQMCLLGTNEYVGILEVALGLSSYLETARITTESCVLVLSKENYERLFQRRFANYTLQKMKETLTFRLYLYIHRSSRVDAPFLKFLTFMLQDGKSLKSLQKQKNKSTETTTQNLHGLELYEKKENDTDTEKLENMMKILDLKGISKTRIPEVETSQRIMNEIETGLNRWIIRSRHLTADNKKNGKKTRKAFLAEV